MKQKSSRKKVSFVCCVLFYKACTLAVGKIHNQWGNFCPSVCIKMNCASRRKGFMISSEEKENVVSLKRCHHAGIPLDVGKSVGVPLATARRNVVVFCSAEGERAPRFLRGTWTLPAYSTGGILHGWVRGKLCHFRGSPT